MTDLLITLTADKSDSKNATLAFTMGVKALEKGNNVDIMLLADGTYLAEKGYADHIDIGDPFKPVNELVPAFLENGGKIKVCKACMVHNGIKEEDMISEAHLIGPDDVIDGLMESKKSLQLN